MKAVAVATIEPDKMLKIKEKEGIKPIFLQSIGEEYVNPNGNKASLAPSNPIP